jgi:hypothetical protein
MNTRHTPPAPAGKPDVCQPTGSAELAMLDVYMPMMKSAAIVSAGQLGLFEALADGALDTQTLAETIQASPRGTASWPTSWSPSVIWKSTASSLPTPPAPSAGSPAPARSITPPACHGPSKPGR